MKKELNTGSHDGVDIRAPIGTPVFTIGHGKIMHTKMIQIINT